MKRNNPDTHEVLWDAVKKGLLLTAVLIFVYIIVYVLAFEQLNHWGLLLSRRFGLAGIAVFSFFVDTIILPTSVDVLFPFVMSWAPIPLLAVMGSCSAAGGFFGYWIARSFNRWGYIQRSVDSYRERGEKLVDRYGPLAVAFAGLTPIPFSTVCWIAGLLKVHAGWTLLACTSRLPRMVLYYLLFRGGIRLFS